MAGVPYNPLAAAGKSPFAMLLDDLARTPPAAVRTYLGTLAGDKSEITETSFRPDEISALQAAIENASGQGRQYITYGDYDPSLSLDDTSGGSVGPRILGDLFNPAKSMAGVVGRARFDKQPDGSTLLTDQYDFGNMSGYVLRDGEVVSVPETYQGDTFGLFVDTLQQQGLYAALRVLGEVAAPEESRGGRPVRIRLK